MARRGAADVRHGPDPDRAPFDAGQRRSRRPTPPSRAEERWVEDAQPGRQAPPGRSSRSRVKGRGRVPEAVARDLARAVGSGRRARAEVTLSEAGIAVEHGRGREAARLLRPLLAQAPEVAAVRDLTGLAQYQLGHWAEAAAHLEAFVRITSSVDRHPVLADCYRALGRYRRVEELWEELRAASPDAALVTEGRIVAAGALADRGQLGKAIALLERGQVKGRRTPAPHHPRLWYALADLYERAGDGVRARELFARVAAVDPSLADTAERLQALA
ncbi:MAG: tetratricopeptide repeat protein [Acidimicrobiales bacterium]